MSTLCKKQLETIEHVLWRCYKSADLWDGLNRLIYKMLSIAFKFNYNSGPWIIGVRHF